MKTQFFSKLLVLSLSMIMFSCASEDNFKRKGLINVNRKISGTYQNTTISKYDTKVKLSNFFELFESDSVVEIKTQKNMLIVGYIDSKGRHYKTFQGKFRNKFFQFYLNYDTLLFPPLIATIQERRVRLSLNENSDLVINEYYDNSGMILFFGAGHSGNSKYTFTKNN